MQQQRTISQSDCDMWWKKILYDNQWQPARSSKALPRAKPAPKKGHDHCLVVRCLSHPLPLSESQQNHSIWEVCSANWWGCIKNYNACSQHWSTERENPSLKQCPITHHTANASKTEWIRLRSFASPGIFTWPLDNWLPLLKASQQLFARKMLSQPAGGRKCFLRVCWIPRHRFLCYRNNKLNLIGKNVLIVMVLILINKDVFELSNDLKFRVWNCNYFFTNLNK